MLDTKYLYSCKYCTKKFMKESAFMQHECTQMIRSREIQSVIGQQSYALYKYWLEKQKKKPPPPETFCTSTFYTSFIKFSNFCRNTSIAYSEIYVDLMVKETISPALWTRDECYLMYIEHIDKKMDPYKQAEDTLVLLGDIALQNNIDIKFVFSTMRYGEVLELVNKKRLSPWILFCSNKFKEWASKLDSNEREHLMKGIGVSYWADRLNKEESIVHDMKMITSEIGL